MPFVTVVASNIRTYSPVWARNSLREVSLGLYLNGDHLDLPVSIDWSLQTEEQAPIKARLIQAATLLAPSFMEQLNSQSELRELELLFNNRLYANLSPFLQLSQDPRRP